MALKIVSVLALLCSTTYAFVIPQLDLQINVNTPVLQKIMGQWNNYTHESNRELERAKYVYHSKADEIYGNTTEYIFEQFERLVAPVA